MKVLAVTLAIGFCLMAGFSLPIQSSHGDRKGTCCTTDSQTPVRMTCHMNAGMAACTCKPHTPGPASHTTCGGACAPISAVPAQSTSLLDRVRRYAVGGYRRITAKNLLTHETRREMYDTIVAVPGIDLRTLITRTGINENTIRYHIDRLESAGKIRVLTIGGISHFFENHGRYSEEEQVLKARMFSAGSSRILGEVQARPGVTRGELAEFLGVAGPTLSRSIRHLADDGLIRMERDGKFCRYYPAWTPMRTWAEPLPAPSMIPG